jgi:hypothetical protein
MAQIIKHRRGSLEALSAVTSSLQKGELVIASGSSNLSVTNGASIVFAVPENGQVQAVNRFLVGASAPNTFAAATYNGMLKGVPYYASGSSTLYLLGEGANEIPNLIGNISAYSSSVSASLSALSASIGSGNIGSSVTQLNTFSASALTRLAALEVETSNLETFSGSQISKDATLATYTGSVETRLTEVGVVTASLILSASAAKTTNDSQGVSITNLNTFSASVNTSVSNLNTLTASALTRLTALEVETSNLETFSASVLTRLTEVGVVTGSLIASASAAKTTNDSQGVSITNLNTFSGSQLTQNTALATVTGSLILSSSANTISVANLNAASASYAKLSGGNVFTGTQVITGSLYISQDLVVQGSSSIQNITSSNLTIGSAFVTLNTATPIQRFAGLNIIDSGSSGGSGSFLYDALQDEFIFVHRGNGTNVTSSHFIMGPETFDSLGNETYLTNNRLPKGTGKEHLNDSQITDDGTTVSIAGNLTVTGSINAPQLTAIAAITGALILSSSAATIANANQNTFTASAAGRLTSLETTSGSVNTSIAALNAYTQSNTSTTALNAFTASAEGRFTTLASVTASLNASTASQQVSIDALNTFSASENGKSATLATVTASYDGRFTTLGTYTASVDGRFSTLATLTGSNAVRLTNLETTSASVNISVTNLNASSASQQVSIDNLNSFSSSQLSKDATLATLTASYDGRFTTIGSVTASYDGRFTSLATITGSLISTASANTISIANINAVTASSLVKLTNLETTSASVNTSISNINSFTSSFGTTFSSSVASRISTLEGTGTIQGVGTSNNVTFAKVTTTGDIVVGGDLVVQGNTVTLNTAQLVVEDKVVTLASGSTSSATADGAGIEIAGASANFVYQHSRTAFTSSVALFAPAVTASINLGTTAGSSKRVAFRNTNGNLDLVPTASVDGDLLQWNGTDFVMSNVIDGGSF